MKNLGFIGGGNMAGAIINGIIRTHTYPAEHICVYDISKEKCDTFRNIGVSVAESSEALVTKSDIIFLAVKPQNFEEVLTAIKSVVTEQKVFVTIAAGISTHYITSTLECSCPVIRAMPNTPLLIGKGATALCRSANVADKYFDLVKSMFMSCGTVSVMNEDKMNAVIGVNSSSPAYIYLFAKAVVDSAVKQGIPADVALPLFCQTLEGSAGMLLQKDTTPEQLIKMVSSPGGTTLKALDALYAHEFEQAIDDAMIACTKRAEELGK
jgi:pyrroline-5-carboxylate reductase